MPIPLLVWAAAGATGAYLAWIKRKEIGEFLADAAKSFGNHMAENMREAKPYIDELMEMEIEEGYHYISKNVPVMSSNVTSGFLMSLQLLSQKYLKAQKFYDKAGEIAAKKPF